MIMMMMRSMKSCRRWRQRQSPRLHRLLKLIGIV